MQCFAEGAALIRDVAIHAIELRVVPCVIDFRAELHSQPFAERRVLDETQIPVIDGRYAADLARGVADLADSDGSEISFGPSTRIIWSVVKEVDLGGRRII